MQRRRGDTLLVVLGKDKSPGLVPSLVTVSASGHSSWERRCCRAGLLLKRQLRAPAWNRRCLRALPEMDGQAGKQPRLPEEICCNRAWEIPTKLSAARCAGCVCMHQRKSAVWELAAVTISGVVLTAGAPGPVKLQQDVLCSSPGTGRGLWTSDSSCLFIGTAYTGRNKSSLGQTLPKQTAAARPLREQPLRVQAWLPSGKQRSPQCLSLGSL